MKYCKHCGIGAVHTDKAKKCVICGGTEFVHDEFTTRQQHEEQLREELRIPKCPTCGSTHVHKISGLDRAASVMLFGIFSKKINKSFKCDNCGYTW